MSLMKSDNYGNQAGTLQVSAQYVVRGSAKAWVNLNGTGTIAVRDSMNVSSLTDNGTGDYTITFTNAMADQNYTSAGHGNRAGDNGDTGVGQQVKSWGTTTRLVGSLRVMSSRHGSGYLSSDFDIVTTDVHGNLA